MIYTVRTLRAIAAHLGVDYAAVRRVHRATWRWTTGGRWYTQDWGVSVRGVGFDVTCACGWESHTGGAIYQRVVEAHLEHLADMIHAAAAWAAAERLSDADLAAGDR